MGQRGPLGLPASDRCTVMGVLNITPDSFSDGGRYLDVDAAVEHGLAMRADGADLVDVGGEATRPGADRRRLVLDPGIGFAKTGEHNWALLARLDALRALGLPVLVGTSRKSFLGTLLAAPDGTPRPVDEREDATVATTVIAALGGAW